MATPKPKVTATVKPVVKKKVPIRADKDNPSKMTPAQKAAYLKNPDRYTG